MEAYPLQWPDGFPRAKERRSSQFKTSLTGALNNVKDSLQRFGNDSKIKVTDIVLSSNVTLGEQNPKDPGVAAWFKWGDNNWLCIAVDIYSKVEYNLQAIFHIVEARRTELRHGGLHIVKQTFKGFKALPVSPGKNWWDILKINQSSSVDQIKSAYHELAKTVHPDKGGSTIKFQELNEAYQKALNNS